MLLVLAPGNGLTITCLFSHYWARLRPFTQLSTKYYQMLLDITLTTESVTITDIGFRVLTTLGSVAPFLCFGANHRHHHLS